MPIHAILGYVELTVGNHRIRAASRPTSFICVGCLLQVMRSETCGSAVAVGGLVD